MTPHAAATVRRTALAVSTALITALPVLAASGTSAGAAAPFMGTTLSRLGLRPFMLNSP